MSFTSDALIVGDDFISEHFFTTDAKSQSFQARVLARRKDWDAAKAENEPSVRSRYTESRDLLARTFASVDATTEPDSLAALYERIRDVLGYSNPRLWTISRIGGTDDSPGPVLAVQPTGVSSAAPLVIVEARAGFSAEELLAKDTPSLLYPFATDDGVLTSVARTLSHLFVSESAPMFALVLAGGRAVITQRERWLEGRTLTVDLQLVGDRNDDKRGGEVDRALTCISAESLAPAPDGSLWWSEVLDESIKHTVGVSKDLREGVRESIEIIANDVVRRRRAQGLPALPDEQAPVLAGQSLRFLYRILFLLYAEASPELAVVPTNDPTYQRGYSLDRLRELLPTELATSTAQNGTHLFDSLAVLFHRVDSGYQGSVVAGDGTPSRGLVFRSLRADLFATSATSLIDEVRLSNSELQRVLRRLLMSKEQSGKDRGFISYAELGINQLGAVYEGLMSYTGFFAHDRLYEVAKNGNPEKGSWVVPESRVEGISKADFVTAVDPDTGEIRPVSYDRGEFVYRLAGRERQQSASYYTPEVLTRFTVGQALEELLDQDGKTTTAAEILELTVCEPALGSGAFAIEAVRQLAEQYLVRRQNELDQRIDPDQYATELQKVKAHIALHQVYGVDLNATAVEFAEISLWLDTMGKGLNAPWFGLHLRRGNSLIGARHAVIPAGHVADKGWIDAMPIDVPLSKPFSEHPNAVHHFLLPSSGWGATADAKEAKNLAKEEVTELNAWRRSLKKKLTTRQVKDLRALALRTEELWSLATKRIEFAESQIRRDIPLWGTDFVPTGGDVSREDIETTIADVERPYQRLRRAMDAWCAMWFWPLTEPTRTVDGKLIDPPTIDEWIAGLTALLGTHLDRSKKHKTKQTGPDLFQVTGWDSLNNADDSDLALAQARSIDTVLSEHPWLVVTERVAKQQGFFHWELDFCSVFARGGFDLQVGNPPWVRPRLNLDSLLAEGDPRFQLTRRLSSSEKKSLTESVLTEPSNHEFILGEISSIACFQQYLSSRHEYPHLAGSQTDLYRNFVESSWRRSSPNGITALIHMEAHLTDERVELFRNECYRRLRRHWHFVNKILLFEEIKDSKEFGVNIYSNARNVQFISGSWLLHPETVINSLIHTGEGSEPGLRTLDNKWNLAGHQSRIIHVNSSTLTYWSRLVAAVDDQAPRMVFAINQSVDSALQFIADSPRVSAVNPQFSSGISAAAEAGITIEASWGPTTWSKAIVQGSHIFVGDHYYKFPNSSMRNKDDWSLTDQEEPSIRSAPITIFKTIIDQDPGPETTSDSAPTLAWRTMTDNTSIRTLKSAVLPPGTRHMDTVTSLQCPNNPRALLLIAATSMSLISDLLIRSIPKSTIRSAAINRLPLNIGTRTADLVILRIARLLSDDHHLANFWNECHSAAMAADSWTGGIDYPARPSLSYRYTTWSEDLPSRRASDTRQLLVELDALAALNIGMPIDVLCTIYSTQFPALYRADHHTHCYDANGRLVPAEILSNWKKKGDAITLDERTAANASDITYVYELPFQFLDREADMRHAYEVFEKRLAEGDV